MTMATRIAVIDSGILQQLDTPQHLYDYPANVFVAGFIGSPAMNFFDAKLTRSDGSFIVDTGSFQIPVPADRNDTYAPFEGKGVILGLRPEDIHDPNYAPAKITAAPVEVKVDVTELMGNEIFVYLVSGDNTFVGRVDPRTSFAMGDQAQIVFNVDNMHLFEKEGMQLAIR
jgi:multiple sugar transport system ATP-binding protein